MEDPTFFITPLGEPDPFGPLPCFFPPALDCDNAKRDLANVSEAPREKSAPQRGRVCPTLRPL